MSFSFSDPAIHDVSDVTAMADDFPANSSPFSRLKLFFINERGEDATLTVFFNWSDRERAHALAAAINASASSKLEVAA